MVYAEHRRWQKFEAGLRCSMHYKTSIRSSTLNMTSKVKDTVKSPIGEDVGSVEKEMQPDVVITSDPLWR